MELTIKGEAKEIAALVLELQGLPGEGPSDYISSWIPGDSSALKDAVLLATTEGAAVHLQGERAGRNFQESE